MNVASFLVNYPPFDSLDPDALQRVAGSVRVEYFPAGAVIVEEADGPTRWLYVVRSGAVELLGQGQVFDLLGEGETFGYHLGSSLLGYQASARAHEDTLCYLLEADVADELLGVSDNLTRLTTDLRGRVSAAGSIDAETRTQSWMAKVGSLVHRGPVICSEDTRVVDAARLMCEQRVSSVLISSGGRFGILTDQDMRARVVAAGRSPDTPVSEVMTFPALVVSEDAAAAEVLLGMLEGGFHHYPVVSADEAIVGVVSDTDLMGLERRSPFLLKSTIERATDEYSVVRAASELPGAMCGLVEVGVDPLEVGHVIALLLDSLTAKFVDLAVQRLGPPPVAWAWMALGSAARQESALSSDQDHAIAYDLEGHDDEEVDRYFSGLALSVTGGLQRAGIPRCSGNVMAVNRALRQSGQSWSISLRRWMDDPSLEASHFGAIVFDYRRVAGPLDIDALLDEVVRTAPSHPMFVRHLARRALDERPPTGFFRDFVVEVKGEHAGRLDLKSHGLSIATNLARVCALAGGLTQKGTVDRLQAAVEAGQLPDETAIELEESFRLLWEVRLTHQCAAIRDGLPPNDYLDPARLGPLSRRHLKEAFRGLARAQRTVASHLEVSRL